MSASEIVNKVWNYAHVLRDDGVGYGDYVEQITYLIFLKMADERENAGQETKVPKKYNWSKLVKLDGDDLEAQYRHTLEALGKLGNTLGTIFRKAQNKIQDPAKLQRPRLPMVVPTRVNERWSLDFVSDQLSNGRRFRVLNIVDDYSREMVGQLVSISITGQQVARFLSQLGETRDLPNSIVCDNGTEFTSKAMFFWSKENHVKLAFIQPGKPTQNAFIESLNGKFRNECLNQHWFCTLDEARYEIDTWRQHYNHVRPHSSLDYMTPLAYAAKVA